MQNYWKVVQSYTLFGRNREVGFAVMDPQRWLWDKNNTTTYFNEIEQSTSEVYIYQNKFYYVHSKSVVTTSSEQDSGRYRTHFLYSMDRDEHLLITPKRMYDQDGIYHSSLLAGKSSLCCGYLSIVDGVLQEIDNGSNHYGYPGPRALFQVIAVLRQAGISLESFAVKYHAPNVSQPIRYPTARMFLEQHPYTEKDDQPTPLMSMANSL